MDHDLVELERQIAQLAALRTPENAAAIDAAILALRGRPSSSGPSGPAIEAGNVENAVLIIGKHNVVNQTLPEPGAPPQRLWDHYLADLVTECRRLPLDVMDDSLHSETEPTAQVTLNDIYIDLDVNDPAPPKKRRGEEPQARERMPLLELLGRESRLVLLGDAGSGKSTFVNYLSGVLADPATARSDQLPEAIRGLIPVRLVLRHLTPSLPGQGGRGTAEMLWSGLEADLRERLGQAASAQRLMQWLQPRICEQGALFFLDGLDEVPEGDGRRACLLQAVQQLADAPNQKRSRILVTARPYAYDQPRQRLKGFPDSRLLPLDQPQWDRFIDGWYNAVRRHQGLNAETARHKAEGLKRAVDDRPHLQELAERPLLLTLMSALHSGRGGELPDSRARLYDAAVELLLGHWQRRRQTRVNGAWVAEPGIVTLLEADLKPIRRAVEQLAYTVHQRQRKESARRDEPADIALGEALAAFNDLLNQNPYKSDALIGFLNHHTGLLIARNEGGPYRFPHRSFQEYLAACHTVRRPNKERQFKALLEEDLDWWREPFLLGVGELGRGSDDAALPFVNQLLPFDRDRVKQPTPFQRRAAILAAQALAEQQVPAREGEDDLYAAVLGKVRGWLEEGMTVGPPTERAEAGDALGRIGDLRPGVGLDPERPGVPWIEWVEIPGGAFRMGSDKGESGEGKAHPVTLAPFSIARYPITVAQYAAFVADGGYQREELWTVAGRAWRSSEMDGWKDAGEWAWFLQHRPVEERDRPLGWGAQQRTPNRPVVGVNWWEALAFCRWLGGRLDLPVTLPSEAQWERAARGPGEGREWPWGAWREGMANTKEAGIKHPSAVGCFPLGRSAEGVQEMAGNVWEWCASLYRPYPCADDGRNDLDAKGARCVRGGGYWNDKERARCSYRDRDIPDDFTHDFGFRVLFSLASS